eukprot:865722-Rhodomonas_salina.1
MMCWNNDTHGYARVTSSNFQVECWFQVTTMLRATERATDAGVMTMIELNATTLNDDNDICCDTTMTCSDDARCND